MNEKIKLSKRLNKIASYITPGVYFADIGSDHAYLPCYVCLKDEQAKAIAGEVAIGPYNSATKAVQSFGLNDRVKVVLGDGLAVIDDDVTEIVIAGMGGSLISSIIENGEDKLQSIKRMIIQPNNNEKKVRETFLKYDYILTEEVIMKENNRIYEILIAEKNSHKHQPYENGEDCKKQLLFGPILLKRKCDVFLNKWQMEKKNVERIIKTMSQAKEIDIRKITDFEEKLEWIKEVLSTNVND